MLRRSFVVYMLILTVVVALVAVAPALGRGGGGGGGGGHSSGGFSGGSHSSGGFSGSSGGFSGSSSRSSGGFSPGGSTSGTGGFSRPSSSTTGSPPRIGGASQALYDKAKVNGTAFTSRNDAVSSFRGKYGSQYTNKFASEPSARPDYIPGSTSVGGRNYTIIYNHGYGGYGYYGPSGAWMMYDVMADAVMLDLLMSHRGYYYGPPYGAYGGYGAPMAPVYYPQPYRSHFLGWLFAIACIVIIIALIRRSRAPL